VKLSNCGFIYDGDPELREANEKMQESLQLVNSP
jgi:hypothetical protein